jgi:hypothetical protein
MRSCFRLARTDGIADQHCRFAARAVGKTLGGVDITNGEDELPLAIALCRHGDA